jgi:hypothetical protein
MARHQNVTAEKEREYQAAVREAKERIRRWVALPQEEKNALLDSQLHQQTLARLPQFQGTGTGKFGWLTDEQRAAVPEVNDLRWRVARTEAGLRDLSLLQQITGRPIPELQEAYRQKLSKNQALSHRQFSLDEIEAMQGTPPWWSFGGPRRWFPSEHIKPETRWLIDQVRAEAAIEGEPTKMMKAEEAALQAAINREKSEMELAGILSPTPSLGARLGAGLVQSGRQAVQFLGTGARQVAGALAVPSVGPEAQRQQLEEAFQRQQLEAEAVRQLQQREAAMRQLEAGGAPGGGAPLNELNFPHQA